MNRFPRTLIEAFPSRYAWRNVIEHHRRPLASRVWDWIFTALLGAGVGIGAFFYLAR